MNKRIVVSVALVGAVAAVVICAVVWRSWSRRYIIEWHVPFRSEASKPVKKLNGNVCIVQQAHTAEPLACADVYLFPHIYGAIGVDEQRMVEWQNENGFDSGGADRSDALLAPGYPIFSRLAWTIVDPVYLEGNELSELLEESKRVAKESNDPAVRANLANSRLSRSKHKLNPKSSASVKCSSITGRLFGGGLLASGASRGKT